MKRVYIPKSGNANLEFQISSMLENSGFTVTCGRDSFDRPTTYPEHPADGELVHDIQVIKQLKERVPMTEAKMAAEAVSIQRTLSWANTLVVVIPMLEAGALETAFAHARGKQVIFLGQSNSMPPLVRTMGFQCFTASEVLDHLES